MSLLRKQWHKIPVSNALKSDAIIMIISLWSWQHITCSWCLYVVVVIGVSVSICLSLSFVPVASWTHLIVSAMWSIYYGLNDVNCCTFCFSFSYFIINSIINVSQSIEKAPCACSSNKVQWEPKRAAMHESLSMDKNSSLRFRFNERKLTTFLMVFR